MIRGLHRLWRGTRRFCSDVEADTPETNVPPKEPLRQDKVCILPIPNHPIFPRHTIHCRLTPEAFDYLLAEKTSDFVGAFVLKPKDENEELEESERVHYCKTNFNRFNRIVALTPVDRIRIGEVAPLLDKQLVPTATVTHLRELQNDAQTSEDKMCMSQIFSMMNELESFLSPQETQRSEMLSKLYNMKFEEQMLDYIGVLLSYMVNTAKVQRVFEAETISERIKATLEVLQDQLQLRTSVKNLHMEAQAKISKTGEEYMYKNILGLLKNKLGMEKDDKETLNAKYKKNLEGKTVPVHVQKRIDEEMERFQTIDKNSSEFHVIRTYLDWLTCLPYGVSTQETLDLVKAREILDRDHFGMTEVKNRIIEFIAVSKLRGTSSGKILCFTGPPGVGKTSIAKSIAEALNRKYFRISLGGLDDVAELKGHRRTYVGAQPGKLISALKQCGAENPVLLIDEVDKVGKRNYQGSPESALLEILDPQQNFAFGDHYMDTQIDLSKVLFICTANLTDEISPVLMDRMESIEVKGYTAEEKKAIFDKHLWGRALKETALEQHLNMFSISEDAKDVLIRDYCREAGVRNLHKLLHRILEKIAVRVLQKEASKVTAESLKDFAGHPPFSNSKLYEVLPAGVVMGLAYTAVGGSTLYIEVAKSVFANDAKGDLKMTGNLKLVMNESIQIAYTFAKALAFAKNNEYLNVTSLHLHFPEGAVPKDGPSAGVTIATALLSLAFNKPVTENLAMTGEISLTGKVLAIGGLKEKIVAARRDGVKTVVIPEANRPTWEELPETLKEGLMVHFAETYTDVMKVALPSVHSL